MKPPFANIDLIGDQLTVEGKNLLQELMERAADEPSLAKQKWLSAGLPEEDISPGHVIPAVMIQILNST